jgi:hypothetical protein
MRLLPLCPLFSLILAGASCAPLCAAAEPDWLAVVGLYPQLGTVTTQEELAVLLWLQSSRTDQDVIRARSEGTPSFGCFADDIHLGVAAGPAPQPIEIANFPVTVSILEQARQDLLPILEALQSTFLRPRPYVTFPAVVPVLPVASTYSYPSTNATLGTVYAQILCQLDPGDQNAITATGSLLGTDRVLGGVHYPSDVVAGQRLGKAFATYWIDQPGRLQLFQAACGEWHLNQ